jgi:3-hydroxymyristoyl/3-hydroxydecanoyl-(acyl carrier protein) dehydratase
MSEATVASRALSHDELFSRIEVLPPYFALQDVHLADDGTAVARVGSRRQVLGDEVGPVSAAETGRHLAILGSISAAFANPSPKRHFYLAFDAEVRRARPRVEPGYAGGLVARGRAHFVDPSTAVAVTELQTEDGRTIYTVVVFYMVVAEPDFRGLFADREQDDAPLDGRPDPFFDVIGLSDISVWDTRLHATLGHIDPYRCAGHFPGLPAMPVAFLMSNIGAAVTRLLHHVLDRDEVHFVVREASLRAENLAFAGERVDIHVEYQRFASGTHWFHCAAIAEETKSVGQVHVKCRVRE